tara:strand:- start:1588 stop:2019 length:432 start_codon:yes stop_codon:yes gene_type:complete
VGLGKQIGELFDAKNGAEVADRVVDMAKLLTGAPSGEDALDVLNADPEARLRFEEALIDNQAKLADVSVGKNMGKPTSWVSRHFVQMLILLLFVAAAGYLAAITFIPLTPQGERYADLVINTLIIGGPAGALLKFVTDRRGLS